MGCGAVGVGNINSVVGYEKEKNQAKSNRRVVVVMVGLGP